MIKKKRKTRYHTGNYESIKGGTFKYRSGWELLFAKYLDSDESVLEFGYECLKIVYITNKKTGRARIYIPDFFVTYSDKKVLYEVKPSKKINMLINKKKFAAAREWCLENNATFELITEIELKTLHLV